MKVLGVFGGIGSMMIGAKQQGYEVIGNIEERPMFFTGTFEANFPGAFMVNSIEDLRSLDYIRKEKNKNANQLICVLNRCVVAFNKCYATFV